ncbi:hypothetical protein [Plantactinospora sp. CA-290183]|uniref:hypothetical protein n=1 Tax=Plantactinospora sp. CA-290183 TaxID=3240006 RepID=UPI003D8FB8ED
MTTQVDPVTGERPATTDRVAGVPVVIVVTMAQRPPDRVVEFVRHLIERGDDVQLFAPEPEAWLELDVERRPPIHRPDHPEMRHPVRWIERLLVFWIPGVVSQVGDWLAGRWPQGVLGRLGTKLAHGQRRVSGG